MPFFQSLSSMFARRAVGDEFSLPTTKFDNAADSPGPSRRGSSYAPTSTNIDPYTRNGTSNGPTVRYPPLSHTFHRLRNTLFDGFPELTDSLNAGAYASQIAEVEQQLGFPLPPPVRESFLAADGQDLDAGVGGIFYGLYLLPLEDMMREWQFWRQAELDPSTGANPAVLATMASIPPQWVKSQYACKGWLPLLSDKSGNYIGVDLDPGPGGSWGQTIIFGRDFDRKCVLWRGEGEGGWANWLASFVDELESGEGWEADKSSDDEEELGYESYSGGGRYGESGTTAPRIAGEYRGWNVLEAWWDKSVKKWEELGLGMDVAAIERGLEEARRLTEGKNKSRIGREEVDFEGIRSDQRTAEADIPVLSTQNDPPIPTTPTPGDAESLLPPASPDMNSVPRVLHPSHSPMRTITPLAATAEHPLKDADYLSPPTRPKRVSKKPPPPAPSLLDLPTRADVQAAQAVARAEASGLRGGWVMNMDTSLGAAHRRALSPTHKVSPSMDAEMVDIDLEGGRGEAFGTPPMSATSMDRQQEEDRLSMAGIEQRRDSRTPALIGISRTPSPLMVRGMSSDGTTQAPRSSTSSGEHSDRTQRGSRTMSPTMSPITSAVQSPSIADVASSSVRRPPPLGAFSDSSRANSPVVGEDVIRGPDARRPSSAAAQPLSRENSLPLPRREMSREGSGRSTDSQDALLQPTTPVTGGANGISSPLTDEPASVADDIADGMEEVRL